MYADANKAKKLESHDVKVNSEINTQQKIEHLEEEISRLRDEVNTLKQAVLNTGNTSDPLSTDDYEPVEGEVEVEGEIPNSQATFTPMKVEQDGVANVEQDDVANPTNESTNGEAPRFTPSHDATQVASRKNVCYSIDPKDAGTVTSDGTPVQVISIESLFGMCRFNSYGV